ncbi:YB1C [Enterospora canceri]|uniref:YB1C n=1 Tax=Enterospora canceri TaxID=1081671 RepID=A0A1Y1S5Z2_9MICR|nr:YB1C [Enterospora canceri]
MIDGFKPDFTYRGTFGLIANRRSRMKQDGAYTFVSLNSRLYKYDTEANELVETYGTTEYAISSFIVKNEWIVIGYEMGMVEICNRNKKLRLHRKSVTAMGIFENILCSGSSDGTICIYDLDLETEQIVSCNSAVVQIEIGSEIFVACGDKSIRKYTISGSAVDMILFDDHIFDFIRRESELFVICKSGGSHFVDLKTNEIRKFIDYNKIKSVNCFGDILMVFCGIKIYRYKMTKKEAFGLQLQSTFAVGDKNMLSVMMFGNKYVGITLRNKLVVFDEKKEIKNYLNLHETEIIQVQVEDENGHFYTLSKERLIKWVVGDEILVVENKVDLDAARAFLIINSNIFIATSNMITEYNPITLSQLNQFDINATKMCLYNDICAVCYDKTVTFYTDCFKTRLREFELPDSVSSCEFSRDGLFTVGCVDGKAYLYNQIDFDTTEMVQKFCLYGHSLPIRSISFSPDNKLIATCSIDKLVKLWSMDFGECRKTFVGDSQNVEFVSGDEFDDDLWFYSNNSIVYQEKFNRLKYFKAFSSGIIKICGNNMIYTEKSGVSLLTMNREELLLEKEEVSDRMVNKEAFITDASNYEKFSKYLMKLSDNFTGGVSNEFYGFIVATDFVEMEQFVHLLGVKDVNVIMRVIENNLEGNTVFNGRLLNVLIRFHQRTVEKYENYKEIVIRIHSKLKQIEDAIYDNDAVMKMEMYGIYE